MSFISAAIMQSPATCSENVSTGLVVDMLGKSDWRAYSTYQGRSDLDDLIRRYLQNHARVPSMLTGEALALVPLEVLRCEIAGSYIEGFLYLNGAVLVTTTASEEIVTLFVADELVTTHGYPDDYIPTPPPHESSTTEDA